MGEKFSDDLTFIPNAALEADQRQTDASAWADTQRASVAQMWADNARAQADALASDMAQQQYPVQVGMGDLQRFGQVEQQAEPVPAQEPAASIGDAFGNAGEAVGNAAGAVGQAIGAGLQTARNAIPTTVDLGVNPRSAAPTGNEGNLLQRIGEIATQYGLDPNVAKAIGITEGGLSGAVGDNGQSFGPFQFYKGGGQLLNFAKTLGIDPDTAGRVAQANPEFAADWALRPGGYLGDAIRKGVEKGLTGADLATFAQRTGQVSVSPERAGQNYGRAVGMGDVQRAGQPDQGQAPYSFPVAGYTGTDVPLHWGSNSGGTDLFAAEGTPVVAMRGGKVISSSTDSIGGNAVLIQGDDGNQYYYAHLYQTPAVKAGQAVAAGDYLGGVGDTGNAKGTGAHLHMGIGPSIVNGAGPQGGTGGDFNAVGLLRNTLAQAGKGAGDILGNVGRTVGDAAGAVGEALDQATAARPAPGMGDVQRAGQQPEQGYQYGGPPDAWADTPLGRGMGAVGQGIGDALGGVGRAVEDVQRRAGVNAPNISDDMLLSANTDPTTAPDPGKLPGVEGLGTMLREQTRGSIVGQMIDPYTDEEAIARAKADPMAAASLEMLVHYGMTEAKAARAALQTNNLVMGMSGEPIRTVGKGLGNMGDTAARAAGDVVGKANLPSKIFRQDKAGFDLATAADKPQGLYMSITEDASKSPHLDVGDTGYWAAPTATNPLRVEDTPVRARGVATDASAGVAALVKLEGPAELTRLQGLSRSELIAELDQRFPGSNYSRYTDSYELLEVYGAQLARGRGHDAIILSTPAKDALYGQAWSEYVALNKDAIGPVQNPTATLRAAGTALNVVGRLADSTNPANQTLAKMYAQGDKLGAAPGLRARLDAIGEGFTYQVTDRQVALANFQKAAEKAKGSPLDADEMAYELSRLNPDMAAKVNIDEGLKPAIQAVGKDRDWLGAYLTHQDNIDVAKAMGQKAEAAAPGTGATVAANRSFSGGLNAADSVQAITDMAADLGPQRFKVVQDAARQVNDFGRQLLQRKVDAGIITQTLADDLTTRYPNYMPTRIVDYLKDPARIQVGKSLSLRDTGLRRNTLEGTTKAREDPLASMVRLAYDTEAMARKNEAFNAVVRLRDKIPGMDQQIRAVPTTYTTKAGETSLTGFVDGVRQNYVVPSDLERAVKNEAATPIPGLSTVMSIFKSLLTSRSPVFLASNALNDAGTYLIRESSRMGGPQNLPAVVKELVKAYGDAFQGLLQGEFKGAMTAGLQKRGGGQFGFFEGTPGQVRATVEELARRNAFAISNRGDLARFVKGIATLEPVQTIGERIELAPRVASEQLAIKRGENAVAATIKGRTVTMDFGQGGNLSKIVNQFVPFFNVGVQAVAQPVRAFGENPRGFVATAIGLIAAPTVAAEAWNRSDPQRAKDYEDVPSYVKDQGQVIMLPGEAQVDKQGNRRPQFVLLKLREYAPIAAIARGAAQAAIGKNNRDWASLLGGSLGAISPINASDAGGVFTSFLPPGIDTGAQLGLNKDLFTGSMITTQRRDESASAASKAIAGVTGARPSQIEFGLRDLTGGPGAGVLAASNLVAGQEGTGGLSEVPVVGGFAGRLVKGTTGQGLEDAQQKTIAPDLDRALKAAGVTASIPPVGWTINGIPLTTAEETKYQKLANQHLDEGLRKVLASPSWPGYTADGKRKVVENIRDKTRERAQGQVLTDIGSEEARRRKAAAKKP